MNIKHIFFDLDHTLWDFEKNSELALQKMFLENNITLGLEDFLEVYKPINKEYWALYGQEKVTKSNLKYGRLKDSFDALNYTISDELIHKLSSQYLDFLSDFNHLFPGAITLLTYLKTNYQLHIITNGFDEVQHKKLVNSNIYSFFETIVTSESVGVKKPNPKIFEHALHLAKATKEESIMIGDNLEADINGALSFGMDAIYCNFDTIENTSTVLKTVCSLSEIKQYL